MKITLPATKARKQFFQLIQEADQPGSEIRITLEGVPKAVIMSSEEFDGWQETLEILADKELMKGIQEGLKEIKSGKLMGAADAKKKLGLVHKS